MKILLVNSLPDIFKVSDEDVKTIEASLKGDVEIWNNDDVNADIIVGYNSNICFEHPSDKLKTLLEGKRKVVYKRGKDAVFVNQTVMDIEILEKSLKRIMIGVPCYSYVEADCMKSISDLIIPDGVEVVLEIALGYTVATARNELTRRAIAGNYDYLFWVDADIILPRTALIQLLAIDADLSTGWYSKKIPNQKDPIIELYGPDKLLQQNMVNLTVSDLDKAQAAFPILGCGLGCTLQKVSTLRKLTEDNKEAFIYVIEDKKALCSEDLYMCLNMTKAGFTMKADPRLKCPHIGKYIY